MHAGTAPARARAHTCARAAAAAPSAACAADICSRACASARLACAHWVQPARQRMAALAIQVLQGVPGHLALTWSRASAASCCAATAAASMHVLCEHTAGRGAGQFSCVGAGRSDAGMLGMLGTHLGVRVCSVTLCSGLCCLCRRCRCSCSLCACLGICRALACAHSLHTQPHETSRERSAPRGQLWWRRRCALLCTRPPHLSACRRLAGLGCLCSRLVLARARLREHDLRTHTAARTGHRMSARGRWQSEKVVEARRALALTSTRAPLTSLCARDRCVRNSQHAGWGRGASASVSAWKGRGC